MRIKVQLKLEKEIDRRLELFAAQTETNKSNVANEALSKYLDEHNAPSANTQSCPTQAAQ